MAGFAAPLIGAGVNAGLSGLAGLLNPRPPALNSQQSGALNTLIPSLLGPATGTPRIDPIQQALMYSQIAQSQTGAGNSAIHSLVGAGLGHSGLLGSALTQVANQAQTNRNTADLGLQQQSVQQKQLSIQDLLGLLGVNTTPGQSGGGAFMAGLAPVAAYSIQNMLNSHAGNPGGGTLPGGLNASNGLYGPLFGSGTPPFMGA